MKFVVFFSLLLVSIVSMNSIAEIERRSPNIVLILVDDMGYGDPQSYVKTSKIPTPNIDQLAREGMKFTDAHSASSVCTPTRYSILTGRYAWRSKLKKGVLGPYNLPLIEADRLTLPMMLKNVGYSTALVGKWHLGMGWSTDDGSSLDELWTLTSRVFRPSIDHAKAITGGPLSAGFDYYFGVDVPNFPPYAFIENDKVLGTPSAEKPNNMYGEPGAMIPGWELDKILPTLTDQAVAYIDSHTAEYNDRPFFLQVTTTSPHTPIVPSEAFIGKSHAGPYGDLVHQTDDTIGQILRALKNNNLEENTLVILTSDNGSPARAGDLYLHGSEFHDAGSVMTKYQHNPNAPWRGMKGEIYEGGHRVPFIVKWPGQYPENTTSEEVISSVDIMATVASIVGYELPADVAEDSYNLSSVFQGGKTKTAEDSKFVREAIVHHSAKGHFSIRQDRWKLIPQLGTGGILNRDDNLWFTKSVAFFSNLFLSEAQAQQPSGQLYDLAADPAEINNLWLEYPAVVDRLLKTLERYKSEGRSVIR